MPTTTDQPPGQDVSGDLAEPKMRSTKWSAIAIVLASIATLVILFVMLNSSNEQSGEVRSVPAQPQTFSPQSQPPVPQSRHCRQIRARFSGRWAMFLPTRLSHAWDM